MARKTPIFDQHVELGGKMVEFAGWNMPVEFEGLRKEHARVREKVGLFDVSHMGEIRVRGDKSLETLEWLLTNHVSQLENGQAQYTLLPNDKGGLVDDLIVYCVDKGRDYLLCVNAANKDKDLDWMVEHNKGADITDESDQWGQIAVQGPKACELVAKIFPETQKVGRFQFVQTAKNGEQFIAARTGYTGEDGFEIFAPTDSTADLWAELLAAGREFGAEPIGLGARDTLRTEMCYSLYGHEIDETTNPYAARLGWVIKPKAKDFMGKDLLLKGKEEGLAEKLVGLKMLDRGIPRAGYSLFSFDNEEVGRVTSGTMSPTLGSNIAIAYLRQDLSELGTEVNVEIRGRRLRAEVVSTPFVKPKGA